jgi:hypothetical protein
VSALLADIVSGETGTADVLFLVAVVLAVLSALAGYVTDRAKFPGRYCPRPSPPRRSVGSCSKWSTSSTSAPNATSSSYAS